ncbi:hypothetical protein OAO87_02555 [bacterium]|nr:hypothetical protein [bacterium]
MPGTRAATADPTDSSQGKSPAEEPPAEAAKMATESTTLLKT